MRTIFTSLLVGVFVFGQIGYQGGTSFPVDTNTQLSDTGILLQVGGTNASISGTTPGALTVAGTTDVTVSTTAGDITLDSSNGISMESQSQEIDFISAANISLEVGAATNTVSIATGVFRPSSFLQASLPVVAAPAVVYCSDCNPDATCTGAGAGAYAFRIGAAWVCELN